MRSICPSDYYNSKSGYKVYLEIHPLSKLPSDPEIFNLKCSEKCKKIENNNQCDNQCNSLACLYDNGECDGIDNPDFELDRPSAFYESIDYTNILLNRKLGFKNRKREWVPHMPFMLSKSIISELQSKLEKEFNTTSSHKLRVKNDVQEGGLTVLNSIQETTKNP